MSSISIAIKRFLASSLARNLLCCGIMLHANILYAQINLIQNPSFENIWRCPDYDDEIEFAYFWSPIDTIPTPPDSFGNINCTPELCHTCATDYNIAVPHNVRFNHYPRTGNAMAQVMMFWDESFSSPYKRDYLQGRLTNNLIAGKSYCVTFYTTRESISAYALNHISAYLDGGQIDSTQNCGLPQTMYIPQISSTAIIRDTLGWTKIEGSFIATGNERFITIGNFLDKAHTIYVADTVRPDAVGLAIYLIDDVSVIETGTNAYAGNDTTIAVGDSAFIGSSEALPGCKWYRNDTLIDSIHSGIYVKPGLGSTNYVVQMTLCGTVTYDTVIVRAWPLSVIKAAMINKTFSMYPNPVRGLLNIKSTENRLSAQMTVYNITGKCVLRQQIDLTNNAAQVPISLQNGSYIAQITDDFGERDSLPFTVIK